MKISKFPIEQNLRGRMYWRPNCVVIELRNGHQIHMSAKPIEQAKAVARQYHMEMVIEYLGSPAVAKRESIKRSTNMSRNTQSNYKAGTNSTPS